MSYGVYIVGDNVLWRVGLCIVYSVHISNDEVIFSAVNVSVKEQTNVLLTVNDNIKDLVGYMVTAAEKSGWCFGSFVVSSCTHIYHCAIYCF